MFDDIKNNIDFFIRNKTKFSRKNFVETNQDLIQRNLNENLYIEDVLKNSFEITPASQVKALDIGSKNWFYARGEYSFFKSFAKDVFLDGIEIDAYRLYSNFYSRYEVAKYYIKDLKNVNYIPGNLLELSQKYDYIIWFLPFVLSDPHIYWGLPKKYFYPQKLLSHAYSLLNQNGQMLIVNQGEFEAKEQANLLKKENIPYKELGEISSEYFSYKHKRYGFLIRK